MLVDCHGVLLMFPMCLLSERQSKPPWKIIVFVARNSGSATKGDTNVSIESRIKRSATMSPGMNVVRLLLTASSDEETTYQEVPVGSVAPATPCYSQVFLSRGGARCRTW
jgi:hypothetical protein